MKIQTLLEDDTPHIVDRTLDANAFRDIDDEWFSVWDRHTEQMSDSDKLFILNKLITGWADVRSDLVKTSKS